MINRYKLVLDTFCEVYDLLKPWADAEFWSLENHLASGEFIPGAIYLIGRQQFQHNLPVIRQLVDQAHIILSNPSEGSDTLRTHCNVVWKVSDLVHNKKILLIGGGNMDNTWPCLQYDSFLAKILKFPENQAAQQRTHEIFKKTSKPYKFLFLNGRMRPNRKYLIESFLLSGLLEQTLWSTLDERDANNKNIQLMHNGQNLMHTVRPIKLLPREYEFDFYQDRVDLPLPTDQGSFVKNHLFNNEWGDIYIKPEQYIDTYFSVVTETVFEYPYSFRTEKIWKPIAMGHPWIAVANYGYYRDLHNLGFQTFGHIIDESFDQIENNTDRLARIVTVVKDLCRQDLPEFLEQCQDVCKYNQQHLDNLSIQVANDFPQRFEQFIQSNYE